MMRTNWRGIGLVLLLAAVAVIGCSQSDGPVAPIDEPAGSLETKSADGDTVNDYDVAYLGRVFDGNQTTFTYEVAGTGSGDPLIAFYLELPDCAGEPAAVVPDTGSFGYFEQAGFYGFKFTRYILPDWEQAFQYALIYDGEIDEGVIYAAVRTPVDTERTIIYGPCAGEIIEGTVFTDTDEDGLRDPAGETGIGNVLVELLDGDEVVCESVTDDFGRFSFLWREGTYTVRVDTTTHDMFFNDDLGAAWNATTALEQEVTIPPDVTGVDFGFSPRATQIIEDIVMGDIVTNGQPLKFWVNEFLYAVQGIPDNPLEIPGDLLPYQAPRYTEEELLAFLDQIEVLALFEPYQFTDGEEIFEVFQILTELDPGDELAGLLQELLVSELNFVSDNGLEDDDGLLAALIGWGESVVVAAQADEEGAPMAAGNGDDDGNTPIDPEREPEVRLAREVFGAINTGGGGGVDE